jgi:hypothetical protein
MRRGLVAIVGLTAALGVAVAPAGTRIVRPQRPAAATTFPLVAIHFEFRQDEFATHYTVVNTGDPNGTVNLAGANYVWTLKPPANDPSCNNHGTLTGTANEFVWKHGDVNEAGHDDGCHHDGLGLNGHEGTVSVQVQDGKWVCNASYTGTQGVDGSPSGNGPAGDCFAPVAPPPPPPPPACKCSKVKAFLNNFHVFGAGTTRIEFDVKWQITCTAGAAPAGCKGRVLVLAPRGANFLMQGGTTVRPATPTIVKVECAGPCGKATEGDETLQYVAIQTVTDKKGKKHGVQNPKFTPQGRAGKTFVIKLGLICISPTGTPGFPTTETLMLKFDKLGQVDYKGSDLNGDTKPDRGQLQGF